MDNDKLKDYIDNIRIHLEYALEESKKLQAETQNTEGDTDLFRKISCYLTPNLNMWVNGVQTGNIRDLNQSLHERIKKKK